MTVVSAGEPVTARSERLRALYAPLAQAAATLQAVVHEKHHRLIPHGMDEDARSRREQERVRDALALASDQGGWLLIESGADRVSASYRAVAFHAGEYMRLFDSRIVDSGETARLLEEHLEAASKAALALISEAQRQLADLDS